MRYRSVSGLGASMLDSAIVTCLALVWGCGASERGFSFSGSYEATTSGFRIHVISRGYVLPADDLARTAFAVAVLCPIGSSPGTAFQMTLTARPDRWITLDCPELGVASRELKGRTSEQVFASLLVQAGYTDLRADEVQGSLRVLLNSLAGPKGVILEGQIESLRVLSTRITYGYDLPTADPPETWITASETPACDGR